MGQLLVRFAQCFFCYTFDFYYLIGENQDYDSRHHNVTFKVGVPSASFSIPITDDKILEQDEMFTIGISLLPINVIVGGVSEATVIIVNDDSKYDNV